MTEPREVTVAYTTESLRKGYVAARALRLIRDDAGCCSSAAVAFSCLIRDR
jgi:hypothetical protein